jgi:hypothetical protein
LNDWRRAERVTTLLLSPLFRDPQRLRHRLPTVVAARVAARVLGAGAAGGRLARAGVDAALASTWREAAPAPPIAARPAPVHTDPTNPTEVTELVYELLDAHNDTAQMATGLASDPAWRDHLDYLRALQRKGRETLAHTSLRSAM